MDFTIFLIAVSFFYGVILFFDTFFKTCAHYPYVQFLKNTGIDIGFFRIKWNTTFFNRVILRLGSSRTRMWYYWFEVGLYISLALLPVTVVLLFVANYQLFSRSVSDGVEQSLPIIEPIVPGVNLPASELGYYIVTLLVCSVVHEFGHALAAVKEDVHLIDLGVSVFFILPVAFVNISTEKLSSISQWRILRIMCAGVWHNIVLVFATGLLYLAFPFLVSPFYETNAGVLVTGVLPKSPVAGGRGLEPLDIITSINKCVVTDESSWQRCLSHAIHKKPGYCVTTDLVHELDESGPFVQLASGAWDCCAPNNPTYMCFEYLERSGGAGVAELPQHVCLPARKIVGASKSFCYVEARQCAEPLHCIRPLLPNQTSLLALERAAKPDVLYVGHPSDIFLTVHVSTFIPKYMWPGAGLAAAAHKLLQYMMVFSAGLAFVNVLPCLFFDGQHIFNALATMLLKARFDRHTITLISGVTTILGTLLLLINFVYCLWRLTFKM